MSLETVASLGVVMAASLFLNLVLMGTKLRTGYHAAMATFAMLFGQRGRQHEHPEAVRGNVAAPAPVLAMAGATATPALVSAPPALTLALSAPPAPRVRPGTHTHLNVYSV